MCLRRGSGVVTGTAWTILLAATPTSSGGLKCIFSPVLHGLGKWAKPGAKRQTQEAVAGWPDLDRDFAEEPDLIEFYLSAILSGIRVRRGGSGGAAEVRAGGRGRCSSHTTEKQRRAPHGGVSFCGTLTYNDSMKQPALSHPR